MIQFLKMKRLISLLPWGVFLIFALLLFRNPFGQRTLIPNLEPYPDTFHYIVPARSAVNGGPFAITRGFGELSPGVPPFYSLILIPFFAAYSDPRVFYLANVALSFISFYLLYLILKRITQNIWVQSIILFLFSTNFFVYWYPQFAMAENLILPIFLGGGLLLLTKFNLRSALIAGMIPVALYATKYAAVPLSGGFSILYLLKSKRRLLISFIGAFIVFGSILLIYLDRVLGASPLNTLANVINSVFLGSSVSSGQAGTSWFSSVYVLKNLPFYFKSLIGEPGRFMWDFTPILPKWLALLGIAGLFAGVINKKSRFISTCLILLILGQVIFISAFYSVDNRYIYVAIPTLLIGVAIGLSLVSKRYLYFLLVIIFGFYFVTSAVRLKSQIMLNLKYAETPWSYISVLKLNDYFSEIGNESTKPVVISSMVPYYIDYFSNGNYELLPLSTAQEFRDKRDLVWGPGDYSDLPALYKKYLREGRSLYVSTYGLGNEAYLHNAFDDLNKDFYLTEVQNECYTQCKIYKVELKNAKGN